MQPTKKQFIVIKWLKWHYVSQAKAILNGWGNFLWFNFEFFSTGDLLKNFLGYFKKDKMSYGRGFDPATFLAALLGNLISRALGAVARTFFIAIALCVSIVILFAGLLVFLAWLFLPVIIIVLFFYCVGAAM